MDYFSNAWHKATSSGRSSPTSLAMLGRPRPKTAAYEQFMRKYQMGRDQLMRGIEIDERFDDKAHKIDACEAYQAGIRLFKEALQINTLDCGEPAAQREVGELKPKIEAHMKSSKERFLQIMNQFPSPPRDSAPSSLPSSVSARSAAGRPIDRTGPTPRTASAGRAVSSRAPASGLASSSRLPPRDRLLKGCDAKFANALLDEVLEGTGVRMDDVAGNEHAKRALEEAVILPALNPSLFSGLRQPVKGILLFGPPGNGKTMLAKAVATESGQVFFNISASSLMSKWVGDGEKTVRCLFQLARNAQPSIVFIDEIDSMLCERSEKETDASRRLKTEFLVQLDGAASSGEERVLVIGATNRPHELDSAVLRRFPKRILLDLPDDRARATLMDAILRKHGADGGMGDRDMRQLASRTAGYSNSDLVALAREAAMVPVRSMDRAKLVAADGSRMRPIKYSDFEEAMRVIRPSTNEEQMREAREFARTSGQCA